MKVESPGKEIERFNQIFDEGESFEKAIQNLPKDNPLIEDEVNRLLKNIRNYKKAVESLENLTKNRKKYNFSSQEIEESDRTRRIYHDGIISAIRKISELAPDNIFFKKLSKLARDKIGEKALILDEYFKLKEKAKKEAA